MKLTKTLRHAFIRAVMDDVPFINYAEQARELATEYVVNLMPPKIRAVWDDKDLRDSLDTSSVRLPGRFSYAYLPRFPGRPNEIGEHLTLHATLCELSNKFVQQGEQRTALRDLLTAVADSVTTTQALIKALPEFEKYVPKEPATTKNLPALTNVVAAFMQAGWPKGAEA